MGVALMGGLRWWSVGTTDALMAANAAESVSRGRYLVAVGGCNDCHTPGFAENDVDIPESEWLTGVGVGWRGPWGTTYATNLRLSVPQMPEEAWVAYVRARYARPPMPWASLHAMTDEDLRSVYRFVTGLGPGGHQVPEAVPPGVEPTSSYYLLEAQGSTAEPRAASQYLHGAAVVLDSGIAVVDLLARTLSKIPISGLVPHSADLSPDKKRVVFAASDGIGRPARLYVAEVRTREVRPLEGLSSGSYQSPRFSADGAFVYVEFERVKSPGCRQLRRLRVDNWSVQDVLNDEEECRGTPAALSRGRVAFLSGQGNRSLRVLHSDSATVEGLASGLDARSELATSPDGRTILFTRHSADETEVWTVRPGSKAAWRVVSLAGAGRQIQPHFVCPKDVLLLADGEVHVLDTWTGAMKEVDGLAPPNAGN